MREGEDRKAQILSGHIEIAFRAGLAGAFIFAFTDDWHTGGHQIENWFFGLTDRNRNPRRAFHAVAEQFRRAVSARKPGDTMALTVWREGDTVEASVQFPAEPAPVAQPPG